MINPQFDLKYCKLKKNKTSELTKFCFKKEKKDSFRLTSTKNIANGRKFKFSTK